MNRSSRATRTTPVGTMRRHGMNEGIPPCGNKPLNPHDRYVMHRCGVPVWTTNDRNYIVAWLWGRDIRDQYVLYDYERPYNVDTPDLLRWFQRLPAE
jgi:hypothetical protein